MILDEQFPNSALTPHEAFPRITPEQAGELVERLSESKRLPCTPAIIVAVWTPGLVKYLVNGIEAENTLENYRKLERKSDA